MEEKSGSNNLLPRDVLLRPFGSKSSPRSAPKQYRVGVVGARGYSGRELVKLLLQHEAVESLTAFFQDPKQGLETEFYGQMDAVNPYGKVARTENSAEYSKALSELDWVFLATPAEASIELAKEAFEKGVSVIDLSGAFRLEYPDLARTDALYQKWYGFKHPWLEGVRLAQEGFVPFSNNQTRASSGPVLIANPGCYATAALMALLPLKGVPGIRWDTLVVDGKSGVTGAGKKAAERLHFAEVSEDILPYRVGNHQHVPEVTRMLEREIGLPFPELQFSTHLVPIPRGMSVASYLKIDAKVAPSEKEIVDHMRLSVANYWGVRIEGLSENGSGPNLSLKNVIGTPKTGVSVYRGEASLTLFSTIDNLLKGAASQAVENFNRFTGG